MGHKRVTPSPTKSCYCGFDSSFSLSRKSETRELGGGGGSIPHMDHHGSAVSVAPLLTAGGGSGAKERIRNKPKRKSVDLGEILRTCRSGRDHEATAAIPGKATRNRNREVDVMDNHLAVAANSGFAVYVVLLGDQGYQVREQFPRTRARERERDRPASSEGWPECGL